MTTKTRKKVSQKIESEEDSERYDVMDQESELTGDSSAYRGSTEAEENSATAASEFVSQYSTDYGSVTESSLDETDSDFSSLQAKGEETLDHPDIMSAFSKASVVGNWFDAACGWMDRPNMCIGNDAHTSLLKKSHIKTTKAMNRLKANETLKRAADSVTKGDGKKRPSNNAQREIGRGAMAAISALTMEAIQPPRAFSEYDVAVGDRDRILESKDAASDRERMQESKDPASRKDRTMESKHAAGDSERILEYIDSLWETLSNDGSNDAIIGIRQRPERPEKPEKLEKTDKPERPRGENTMAAKMKEVSARATEILKKNLDTAPPKKTRPTGNLKTKSNAVERTSDGSFEENDTVFEPSKVAPRVEVEAPDLEPELGETTSHSILESEDYSFDVWNMVKAVRSDPDPVLESKDSGFDLRRLAKEARSDPDPVLESKDSGFDLRRMAKEARSDPYPVLESRNSSFDHWRLAKDARSDPDPVLESKDSGFDSRRLVKEARSDRGPVLESKDSGFDPRRLAKEARSDPDLMFESTDSSFDLWHMAKQVQSDPVDMEAEQGPDPVRKDKQQGSDPVHNDIAARSELIHKAKGIRSDPVHNDKEAKSELVHKSRETRSDLVYATNSKEETKPALLSHNELRKQVFDTILSKKESNVTAYHVATSESRDGQLGQTVPVSSQAEQSRRAMGTRAHGATERKELVIHNQLTKTSEAYDPVGRGPFDDSSHRIKALLPSHSITDLTHINDGFTEGEESGDSLDEEDRAYAERTVTKVSSRSDVPRQPPPSTPTAQSTFTQKGNNTKKDAEVISVFELDDDDSWTPGDRPGQVPEISDDNRTATVRVTRPNPIDPVNAYRTSLEDSRNQPTANQALRARVDRAHAAPSLEQQQQKQQQQQQQQKQQQQRRQARTSGEDAFSDPQAREAFLGLRRGRLETRERALGPNDYEPKFPSTVFRNVSLHGQSFEDTPAPPKTPNTSDLVESKPVIPYEQTGRALREAANTGLEFRRRAMGATNEQGWSSPEPQNLRTRHLVSVRSIDEAQRLRNERAKALHESDLLLSPTREDKSVQKDMNSYRSSVTRQSPIDVHEYISATQSTREVEEEAVRKSFHQRYDRTYIEARPLVDTADRSRGDAPQAREKGIYNSVIINRSKNREGGIRPNDVRDDVDTPYNSGRRDPSGYIGYEHPSSMMMRNDSRSMNRNQDELSHRSQDFETLDRRMSGLKVDDRDKRHWNVDPWSSESSLQISGTDVRRLERRLEEKRTSKLNRIRTRKTPPRHPTLESMDDAVHYDPYGTETTKLGQMKMLRDTRTPPRQLARRPMY